MSIWSHVAGIVRVDFWDIPNPTQESLKKIFKTCNFKSTRKEFKECNVPKGSEGSIDFKLIDDMIIFYGDLRDYDKSDIPDFKKWWNKTMKKIGSIRQAVVQIDFEDLEEPVILNYFSWK